MTTVRTVLFHRDFENFTGGHLKVWHYFNHVEAAEDYRAQIYFSDRSLWDETNPWMSRRDKVLASWNPRAADSLFLGGYDWLALPAAERDHWRRPIFNLIQHVHHADPAHPLSEFLRHRAIRVCVSEQVADAIRSTGKVNGPVFVIPNGIDLADLPTSPPPNERPFQWLICGLKENRSELARRLAACMEEEPAFWGRTRTLTKLLPRGEFLAAMAEARRVVLLPRATEGFYLPMLEAMALGALTICPDCVGNRSFRVPGFEAIVPQNFSEPALLAAMRATQTLSPGDEARWLAAAREIAARHDLARERAAFHRLLAGAESLW